MVVYKSVSFGLKYILYKKLMATNIKSDVIMKTLKSIPKFKNEDEEREFWTAHDSTDYIDWSKAKRVTFRNLKPFFMLT